MPSAKSCGTLANLDQLPDQQNESARSHHLSFVTVRPAPPTDVQKQSKPLVLRQRFDRETLVLIHDALLLAIDLRLPVGIFAPDPIFGALTPHLSVSERAKFRPVQMSISAHFANLLHLI